MRALRLPAWKHEPEVAEITDPEPGPGEVVIRVGGAGACHSDLHLMHDFEPGVLSWGPPFTLGHENAGWVDAIGAGVKGLEIGEPMAVYGPWGCGRCYRCRQGMENYCERQAEIGPAGGGLGLDGGMAPKMLVPSARLLAAPARWKAEPSSCRADRSRRSSSRADVASTATVPGTREARLRR
jgi:propanol-preferring alcohol dehydrogenase